MICLLPKLNAYGFDQNSLHLLNDYLTSRYQRIRIGSNYNPWREVFNGAPQGSIIGPTIFNIYLIDLFFFTALSEIASCADDKNPYTCTSKPDLVVERLKDDSHIILKWVSDNALKANPGKFHLLLNSNDFEIFIDIDNHRLYNSPHEKLLGMYIDNKLTFDEHVTRLCNKASQKLHALARVSSYMTIEQRRKIMNAYINSQFGYCPLVWVFHSRTLNNRINKIHERALHIINDGSKLTYDELLHKDNSFTIHERNIQALAIEMYKIMNNTSPVILKQIVPLKEINRYCSRFASKSRNVNTVLYGTETISFLGPKIWSIIPTDMKNATSFFEFKRKIRKWKPVACPCRLCKLYIAGVDFVNDFN